MSTSSIPSTSSTSFESLPISKALSADVSLSDVVSTLRRSGLTVREARAQFEKRWIVQVLDECHGNQCKAARELGMHRNTLERRMDKLKIARREGRLPSRYWREKLAGLPAGNGAQPGPHCSHRLSAVNSTRKGGRGKSPEPPAASSSSVGNNQNAAGVICGGLSDPEDAA